VAAQLQTERHTTDSTLLAPGAAGGTQFMRLAEQASVWAA